MPFLIMWSKYVMLCIEVHILYSQACMHKHFFHCTSNVFIDSVQHNMEGYFSTIFQLKKEPFIFVLFKVLRTSWKSSTHSYLMLKTILLKNLSIDL